MVKRKYVKTRRAEQQDQTRERIVEAAVRLHARLGPANTSISAIAGEAGVQRLTVYRHFPDDTSLFLACTSHYFGIHPPPAMVAWQEIEDASERCRVALLCFYRYYRQTEKMLRAGYRDLDQVDALKEPIAQFEAYVDLVCEGLVKAWKQTHSAKKQLRVTLRHALRFSTWQSFQSEKLSDGAAAQMVTIWLTGIV